MKRIFLILTILFGVVSVNAQNGNEARFIKQANAGFNNPRDHKINKAAVSSDKTRSQIQRFDNAYRSALKKNENSNSNSSSSRSKSGNGMSYNSNSSSSGSKSGNGTSYNSNSSSQEKKSSDVNSCPPNTECGKKSNANNRLRSISSKRDRK